MEHIIDIDNNIDICSIQLCLPFKPIDTMFGILYGDFIKTLLKLIDVVTPQQKRVYKWTDIHCRILHIWPKFDVSILAVQVSADRVMVQID